MNTADVVRLLQYVNLHDRRKVDEATVRDWLDLLGDLDYAVAHAAVREHRMNSLDYLQIAHIRAGAKRFAGRRRATSNARPAIDSGPASFQRSEEEQAAIKANVARLRVAFEEARGGRELPQADARWIPAPVHDRPAPPRSASATDAARREEERRRQLRLIEAAGWRSGTQSEPTESESPAPTTPQTGARP